MFSHALSRIFDSFYRMVGIHRFTLVVDIYFLLAALLLLHGQPISFVRTCHISQCHAPEPITKSDTA